MSGDFYANYREETMISRLESSQQSAWGQQLSQLSNCTDELARRLSMKLVDNMFIETNNLHEIKKEVANCLGELLRAEDFDIQYVIAPLRNLISRPNRVSLYITSFIIEQLINHRSVIDIFGTDEDIYNVINQEVTRLIK